MLVQALTASHDRERARMTFSQQPKCPAPRGSGRTMAAAAAPTSASLLVCLSPQPSSASPLLLIAFLLLPRAWAGSPASFTTVNLTDCIKMLAHGANVSHFFNLLIRLFPTILWCWVLVLERQSTPVPTTLYSRLHMIGPFAREVFL
ncbi:unnamed protein product [Prorocentrum cordatum]|uniref:Uncharacterized protein n=1 Tax=Prorocentrum cordatum TaxID=2364126 RepID=A0ABN9VGF5_9DINO|nr:unnamed protein product [Polarella glacialis]CAK0871360.1 unnamed protein product [Polarella glacialis]